MKMWISVVCSLRGEGGDENDRENEGEGDEENGSKFWKKGAKMRAKMDKLNEVEADEVYRIYRCFNDG